MKKGISALLLSVGLISTLSMSAGAFEAKGSCNNVPCQAQLNMEGTVFRAGTYADKIMANISVTLDGKKEWWQEDNFAHDTTSAYVKAKISSADALSDHHADNHRGDVFNRKIQFKNGNFNIM